MENRYWHKKWKSKFWSKELKWFCKFYLTFALTRMTSFFCKVSCACPRILNAIRKTDQATASLHTETRPNSSLVLQFPALEDSLAAVFLSTRKIYSRNAPIQSTRSHVTKFHWINAKVCILGKSKQQEILDMCKADNFCGVVWIIQHILLCYTVQGICIICGFRNTFILP